jgi:hypothetical protein
MGLVAAAEPGAGLQAATDRAISIAVAARAIVSLLLPMGTPENFDGSDSTLGTYECGDDPLSLA